MSVQMRLSRHQQRSRRLLHVSYDVALTRRVVIDPGACARPRPGGRRALRRQRRAHADRRRGGRVRHELHRAALDLQPDRADAVRVASGRRGGLAARVVRVRGRTYMCARFAVVVLCTRVVAVASPSSLRRRELGRGGCLVALRGFAGSFSFVRRRPPARPLWAAGRRETRRCVCVCMRVLSSSSSFCTVALWGLFRVPGGWLSSGDVAARLSGGGCVPSRGL